MTDKEIFDNNKAAVKDRKRKIKMLRFLKVDVNRKLVFMDNPEEDKINLLSELNAIEVNITKLTRNRFNSAFYEFNENKLKV